MTNKQEPVIGLLVQLGCERIAPNKFRHKEFGFDFCIEEATKPDKLLLEIWELFSAKAWENCQYNMRSALGLE